MLSRIRSWLEPLVYLTNNVLSLAGVVLVTASAVLWVVLLPTLLSGEIHNPYMGILLFMGLPAAFFAGLFLIPFGMWMKRRRGHLPETYASLDWKNAAFRRLIAFVAATTVVNLIIAGQLSYGAVNYMDSVQFCGQTCHTVMQPEFVAYQSSPHARVECVKCHIGPGAGWFVRSKLSGVGQVIAVTLNNYPRPIPTPVHNLRPARETCETCHWPQKFGGERLRVVNNYADDEANTATKTVLMMHIGGGTTQGPGIHGYHLGKGITVRYFASDEGRQTIPLVERTTGDGKTIRFVAGDAKPDAVRAANDSSKWRVMDCMDCHNRPSHTYQLPERAVNNAITAGDIPGNLPWAKKHALEALKGTYSSHEDAAARLPAAFAKLYQDQNPDIYAHRRSEIEVAGKAVFGIYSKNVFPEMKVNWGGYPNNLGHTDFPGCFRCHDDNHQAQGGQTKISQDCNSCHNLLAMDEANPKVLTDLGIGAPAPAAPATAAGAGTAK